MRKKGALKISEYFFLYFAVPGKALNSQFFLKNNYSVKLNWKCQGGRDRVAGSNQRTILREVWISFWNHTM